MHVAVPHSLGRAWSRRPPEASSLSSPQVQNVHGAFNALGGADRLTSNRTCPPGAASRPGTPAAGREGEGGTVLGPAWGEVALPISQRRGE